MQSWISGPFELSAPWGIDVATPLGWFYLVVEGRCVVQVPGDRAPHSVATGDLLLVAQGQRHCLCDVPGSPSAPIQHGLAAPHFERRETFQYGGGGARTRLFCGCFLLDGLEQRTLHTVWPALVHMAGQRQKPPSYLDHLLHLLELEAEGRESGAQTIMDQLVRILLTKVVQGHLGSAQTGHTHWLRALPDADLGRALRAMHARLHEPWTVAALADEAAMARSTFSARFTELAGLPPLEYLTRTRMQRAGFLLRTTRVELKAVAARVGYESPSAFSKAFTRWTGTAPGLYRRAAARVVADRPGMPPL